MSSDLQYAGLRRELEIGLCLAPTRATAVPAAKALAAHLDATDVRVRLAGLAADSSRVLITVAVCLGTIDGIKAADADSRQAVLALRDIVEGLSAYDPSFVTIPEPSSIEARLAAAVTARVADGGVAVLEAVEHLASVR